MTYWKPLIGLRYLIYQWNKIVHKLLWSESSHDSAGPALRNLTIAAAVNELSTLEYGRGHRLRRGVDVEHFLAHLLLHLRQGGDLLAVRILQRGILLGRSCLPHQLLVMRLVIPLFFLILYFISLWIDYDIIHLYFIILIFRLIISCCTKR